MITCPFCKQGMDDVVDIPRMSARMERVYRAVVESGPAGIDPKNLLVKMYADEEWPTPGGGTVLRVVIHDINERISSINQRITNWHRGNYRLVKIKEEIQQAADHQAGHGNPQE